MTRDLGSIDFFYINSYHINEYNLRENASYNVFCAESDTEICKNISFKRVYNERYHNYIDV